MTTPDAPTGPVLLSDILGRDRTINLFASLTRESEATSTRLENDKAATIVLSPLNSAVERLPRKPWEKQEDYKEFGEDAYEGVSGQSKAKANLQRFVEAHYVPRKSWEEGKKVKTVAGREVWWVKKGDEMVIMPDEIKVLKVSDRVANGELWIIQGVLKYN